MTTLTQHQDVLWIGALAAAPVAVLIALMCRGVARPATRHVLWCLALLTFVVPGALMATGSTRAIGEALLGVPRALAWAFPPERAEDEGVVELGGVELGGVGGAEVADVAGMATPGDERASWSPHTPPMPPLETRSTPVPSSEAARSLRTLGDAGPLGGVDAIETLMGESRGPARAGAELELLASRPTRAVPGAEVPLAPARRERRDSPAPTSAPAERLSIAHVGSVDVAGAHPSVEAASESIVSERLGGNPLAGGKPAPAATLSGLREIVEPRKLVGRLVSGLADRLIAALGEALGQALGVPLADLGESRIRASETADAAGGAGDAGGGGSASAPRAHARGSDANDAAIAPTILDPIWNGLASASGAMESWAGSLARAARSILDIPAPPAALWIGGIVLIAALGGARTLAGHAAIRRVTPVDRTDRRLVQDLSEKLGLRHAPKAYLVRSRISPMVCGGLNPRIILPEALWRTLDLDARRAVLTHELAHLRRRDQWVRLMELVIGVLYWWHPVLWAIRRRIRDEADLCCDAWVTTLFPGLRRSYAEALLRTRCYLSIPGATAPVAGLGMASARSRRFSRRLTMVMTGQTRPKTSPLGLALALAVGTAALVIVPSIAQATLAKKTELCPPEATSAVSASATPAPVASGRSGATTVAAPAASRFATGGAAATPSAFGGSASASSAGDSCCATVPAGSGGGAGGGGGSVAISSDPLAASPVGSFTSAGGRAGGRGGAYAPTVAAGASGFPTSYSPVASTSVRYAEARSTPAPSQGDLNDRVRALEARIDALDASIQRLLQRMEVGGGAGAFSPFGATAPTPQPAAAYQAFNSMPQFELAAADDGEAGWVSYSLPQEKVEAVYELMSRDDIPIYVRLEDGSIALEGTPSQQRVFAQFLALIHPEGADEWTTGFFSEGDGAWREEALAGGAWAERGDLAAEMEARAQLAVELAAEMARHGGNGEAWRAEREAALTAREGAMEARAAALEAELHARHGLRRELAADARTTAQRRIEEMTVNAERLAAQADELEQKARLLYERASSARNDSQREAFEAQAQAVEAHAEATREAADAMREQADEAGAEVEEAMAEMDAELADARAEIEEALAEARAELDEARAEAMEAADNAEGEAAENCACDDDCAGEECADDCDEDCHCHAEAAAPTPPAAPTPAREARPARAPRPASAPAAPRPIRD